MKRAWAMPMRVALPVLLLLGGLLVIGIGYLIERASHRADLLERARRETARVSSQLAARAEHLVAVNRLAEVRSEVTFLRYVPDLLLAYLADADGKVLAATRLAMVDRTAPPLPAGLRVVEAERGGMRAALGVDGRLRAAVPVTFPRQDGAPWRGGEGVLYTERDLSAELRASDLEVRGEAISYGAILAVLVLVTGLYHSLSVARPLARLRAGAMRIAAGERGVRVAPGGAREIVALTDAFNQMAAAIETGSEDLEATNERITSLLEALDHHAIVSTSDASGTIIDVNERFSEASGYSREELLGANHRLLKSGFHGQDFYEHLWRSITAGRVWHGLLHNRRKDGSPFWVQTTIVPIRDAQGAVQRYIALSTDVSRRERLRRGLHVLSSARPGPAESIYDVIARAVCEGLGNSFTAIGRLNPDGEHVDVVGCWRDGARAEPFSYPLAGSPCEDVCTRSRRLVVERDLARRYPRDEALKRSAAESYRGQPMFDDAGQQVGLLAALDGKPCVEDEEEWVFLHEAASRAAAEIEREALQRQLQQAQKMEALGRLIGGVAHDFNNILASVVGYAEMSLRREAPDSKSPLAGYLREITRAADRGRDLVKRMLLFAREGSGESSEVALARAATECVRMLESVLPSGVRVACDLPKDDLAVLADSTQLQQVLMNLFLNARDAVDGVGTVSLHAGRRHVESVVCASCQKTISGDYVELGVCDDGCGIPPELTARIFDPFVTTKPVGKGTGLGLSMVHGIVHQHGGHVLLETQRGKGTCFRLLWIEAGGLGTKENAAATPVETGSIED